MSKDLFKKDINNLSGRTTSHSHKFDGWENKEPDGENSVRKMTILDVQWSDCPVEVEEEVKSLWKFLELRNDYCVVKVNVDEELLESYPLTYKWLVYKGVEDGEEVWIHWWW